MEYFFIYCRLRLLKKIVLLPSGTIYLDIQIKIVQYFLNSFQNNVFLIQILFYIWSVKEDQGINK